MRNSIVLLQTYSLVFLCLIEQCNLVFDYFSRKNIKTLCIRINSVKQLAVRMFFYFFFVFRFLRLDFCQYVLFNQFLQHIYAQKNTFQSLLFRFLKLCAAALFFLQKMLLIGVFNYQILLIVVFFNIKLI